MNIVLEGNINFYEELQNINDTDDESEDKCLLSNIPLDNNKVKLPCNHEFNLLPLYKEVFFQKIRNNVNHMERIKFGQIKCPYCRQIHNRLLPHIRINNTMSFVYGVNSPEQYCMSFHKCSHIFKSGQKKNHNCDKTAYYNDNGCFCSQHHTIIAKKIATSSNQKETTNTEIIAKCKAILKYGKRIGQECGSKIKQKNCEFCKKHTPK